MRINSIADCEKLQSDINSVLNWCERWRLKLNSEKCQVITYSLKKQQIKFDYEIKSLINRYDLVRDLGVSISSKFNFGIHIDQIVRSAFKMLGLLKRKSVNFKSKETVLTLKKF